MTAFCQRHLLLMTDSKKILVCPYCGETQPAADRCRSCRGLFEPLSLQASQNDMGPWFVYEPGRPFRPGCSYETMARRIERGQITRYTVVRGPTTRQFWTVARHVAGVAHLLGYCHACDAEVDPDAHGCHQCGVPFGAYLDRNHLGLSEVQPLPGEAPHDHHHDEPGFAPNGRSLSSFASDEELVATMTPRTPVHHAPAHEAAWSAPAADHEPRGDVLDSPLVRSMQRRLQRQQRTIRFLTILVIAVAVAGTAITVVGLGLRGEAATQMGGSDAITPALPEGAPEPELVPASVIERDVQTPAIEEAGAVGEPD